MIRERREREILPRSCDWKSVLSIVVFARKVVLL